MASTVASRFAVLCDDAEDVFPNRKHRRQQVKKPEDSKPAASANGKGNAIKKKKNKENVQVSL